MTSKNDDDDDDDEIMNYGGRLNGMSQQERGRLWGKLKTGGTGPQIMKKYVFEASTTTNKSRLFDHFIT